MSKVMLDLFSGIGSVKKAYSARGYKTVTLDRDHNADFKVDIMDWDYTLIPKVFEFIGASPRAQNTPGQKLWGFRKLEDADAIVRKSLENIEYFKPEYGHVVGNPQTGLLKDRDMMQERPYSDIDD